MRKTTSVILASSADRSAADVAIPVAVGETGVAANGVPGTGTIWYPPFNGFITDAFVNSETAAMVETWFHKTTDADRMKLLSTHLQTDPVYGQILNHCSYPVTTGDGIYSAGENGGAVLDCLALNLSASGADSLTSEPPAALPLGAKIVRATGATTLTADALVECPLTWDDFNPERDVVYDIIAIGGDGATACLARLKFIEGPDQGYSQAFPMADTSTGLEYQMFYARSGAGWGSFGSFKGQTPPVPMVIGVAGDTAQCFRMIVVPKGRSK